MISWHATRINHSNPEDLTRVREIGLLNKKAEAFTKVFSFATLRLSGFVTNYIKDFRCALVCAANLLNDYTES